MVRLAIAGCHSDTQLVTFELHPDRQVFESTINGSTRRDGRADGVRGGEAAGDAVCARRALVQVPCVGGYLHGMRWQACVGGV